jgi:hypothetical protein
MATSIKHPWVNGGGDLEKPLVTLLDNDHVLIIANADTDADGAPDVLTINPSTGQRETSLGKPAWKGTGDYVNARTIPYFVLPVNWTDVTKVKVQLGDLAKITYNGRHVYAILADRGPTELMGELSIAAVEALGESPWNSDKTRIISGIPHGVSYEIIPNSRDLNSTTDFETIQVAGLLAFKEHPQIIKAAKYLEATWLELNRTDNGRPTITAYNAGNALYTRALKGKSDLIDFLNLFPNARSVLVAEAGKKAIPDCPDPRDPQPPVSGPQCQKFASFFKNNYEAVRSEVDSWFTKPPAVWANNPITNGCVAHQVSCLHLCGLSCPEYDTIESVNVDAFIAWAEANGWTRVENMEDLLRGDVCVSASSGNVYDHVYCFDAYADNDKTSAYVLHNRDFGLAERSLVGGENAGAWKFALRMPE